MRPSRFSPHQQAEIRQQILAGVKYAAIAAAFKVNDSYIYYIAKKLGHRRRYPLDKSEVRELLKQLPAKAVAAQLGRTVNHIRKIARQTSVATQTVQAGQ